MSKINRQNLLVLYQDNSSQNSLVNSDTLPESKVTVAYLLQYIHCIDSKH